MAKKKWETQIVPDETLESLTLQKRYNFVNLNLLTALDDEEKKFLDEVQKFCIDFDKKNSVDFSEDPYDFVPAFGEAGYLNRMNNYKEIDVDYGDKWGLRYEFGRTLASQMFHPSLDFIMTASMLCINPLKHHHQDRETCLTPLKELITGKAIGCICITEPKRGSDATHLDTVAKRTNDGIVISGEKCYQSNGPKSKYGVIYGTEDPSAKDSENRMSQSLVHMDDPSIKVERVNIPSVPKIHLGKETFTDTFVPNDRILCDVGKGKLALFEGLAPERMSIAIMAISMCWGAISIAALYASVRKQFGQEVIKFQGIGFTLAEFIAKTTNLTLAILAFCRTYDGHMKQHNGNLPGSINQSFVMNASQLKYQATLHAAQTCYEMANLMGGSGLNDNTIIDDYLGISRIQEVIGGTRQIQQFILTGAIQKMCKSC
ncbi:MAG: hypothetical protein GY754_09785 [bacterium]|nr:hypothetical protein [bacterium]